MTTMTDSRAAEVLAAHNEWRRGGDGPETDPTTLGLALDHAIARLREPAGVGIAVFNCPTCPVSVQSQWQEPECPECGERCRIDKTASPKPPAEAQAQGGGEVDYEFEVWQDDSLQAGGSTSDYATAKSEADHYALMYGQDGPVEVRMYEKRRITAPPSAPVGVETLTEQFIAAFAADEAGEGSDPAAGLIGPAVSAWLRALAQQPAPVAPVGVEVASLPALWRQREDNGEEHTEYDKGFETASDECARMLEAALAQQPAAVEIEALRAEVAEWKRVAAAQAELHDEAEAHAERLAEALREVLDNALRYRLDECDHCVTEARAALHLTAAQENDDA